MATKNQTALELLAQRRELELERLRLEQVKRLNLEHSQATQRRSLIKSVAISAVVAGVFITYLNRNK
tara:strand:- start:10781 stop:10981 length:201 start_codon:yes stop_codon:yes gene_type:complete